MGWIDPKCAGFPCSLPPYEATESPGPLDVGGNMVYWDVGNGVDKLRTSAAHPDYYEDLTPSFIVKEITVEYS